jgi:hypothetical protein
MLEYLKNSQMAKEIGVDYPKEILQDIDAINMEQGKLNPSSFNNLFA